MYQELLTAVQLGRVASIGHDGRVTVVVNDGGESREVCCEVMRTGREPLDLRVGDKVLWVPVSHGEAVVLGAVGRDPVTEETGMPTELVIEAGEQLTLKAGDGSITIRADGRVLIKGRDLVSHATRTNRIRGGSVAIN